MNNCSIHTTLTIILATPFSCCLAMEQQDFSVVNQLMAQRDFSRIKQLEKDIVHTKLCMLQHEKKISLIETNCRLDAITIELEERREDFKRYPDKAQPASLAELLGIVPPKTPKQVVIIEFEHHHTALLQKKNALEQEIIDLGQQINGII